jgi:glycosyltransferase involved in cell wall biosynthesis
VPRPASTTILFSGFVVSGGSRIITSLANALATDGHSVEVLVPQGRAAPTFPLNADVIVTEVSTRTIAGFWMTAARRAKQSDIVVSAHAFGVFAAAIGRVGRRRCWFWQGDRTPGAHPRPSYYVVRAAEVVARVVAGEILSVAPLPFRARGRVTIIRNGVDTVEFHPSREAERERVVVAVVSVSKPETLEAYDEVAEAVHGRDDTVVLRVLTPLPWTPRFARRAEDTDVSAFLRTGAAFLSLSVADGFGLPPLEAMASGVPVVARWNRGIASYVRDTVNGLLVHSADASDFVGPILAAIDDHDVRSRLIEQGLATAEHHSILETCEQYRAYFASSRG